MLSTDRQTDRQTNDQRYQKHNLLRQGGNNVTMQIIKCFKRVQQIDQTNPLLGFYILEMKLLQIVMSLVQAGAAGMERVRGVSVQGTPSQVVFSAPTIHHRQALSSLQPAHPMT